MTLLCLLYLLSDFSQIDELTHQHAGYQSHEFNFLFQNSIRTYRISSLLFQQGSFQSRNSLTMPNPWNHLAVKQDFSFPFGRQLISITYLNINRNFDVDDHFALRKTSLSSKKALFQICCCFFKDHWSKMITQIKHKHDVASCLDWFINKDNKWLS